VVGRTTLAFFGSPFSKKGDNKKNFLFRNKIYYNYIKNGDAR
jgi:hypothetical protein